MKVYKFRNCVLDIRERIILLDGQPLRLTTKTFDVLELLVMRAGKIVSKDEMFRVVWNGESVEEGNLAVHIAKLRRELKETETERFIETIHGIGYRFLPRVEQLR